MYEGGAVEWAGGRAVEGVGGGARGTDEGVGEN